MIFILVAKIPNFHCRIETDLQTETKEGRGRNKGGKGQKHRKKQGEIMSLHKTMIFSGISLWIHYILNAIKIYIVNSIACKSIERMSRDALDHVAPSFVQPCSYIALFWTPSQYKDKVSFLRYIRSYHLTQPHSSRYWKAPSYIDDCSSWNPRWKGFYMITSREVKRRNNNIV